MTFEPAAHPGLRDLGTRLRALAGDAAYRAGRVYLQKGQVKQAAVAGTTAYATVTGSTDYRISIAFGGDEKVTCTCPAHRRNRYCKHVVAVCVALLERPGDFAEVEPAPEPEPAKASARRRPSGRAARGPSVEELRASGLETVDRVLTELADGGLMSLGPEKAQLIASAANLVRGLKLRRMGNLLMALQHAATQAGHQMDERTFCSLLTDLELARQASQAHLEGRAAMDPQLAEELIGKTWRDDELEPVQGLELLGLASLQRNDGEFRIRSVYLADLQDASIYVDRQIVPLRLAFKPPPRSRSRLLVDEAGLYPGLPPRRIKLQKTRGAPLTAGHMEQLIAHAADSVASLRALITTHLQSPFGNHEAAILFRPARLLEVNGTTTARDSMGERVAVSWPDRWGTEVRRTFDGDVPIALFGLLALDRGVLHLNCQAVVGAELPWPIGPVIAGEE